MQKQDRPSYVSHSFVDTLRVSGYRSSSFAGTPNVSPQNLSAAAASNKGGSMSGSSNDQNSVLTRYFTDIRQFPALTRERERDLSDSFKAGCRISRDALVESNLGFVVKVANEYRNLGVQFEDLLNEGNLGLIEAAQRFDASKGTKFITYAIWWIRKSILKALSERSTLVRVPSYQMKKVREIRETEQRLCRTLGRAPDREEISATLERSLTKVDQVLQYSHREVSLDHKVGKEREQPISDFLVDENSTDAEEKLIRRENSDLVSLAMRELTDQEKAVVCHRFGLRDGTSRTLKEVGQIMKISRERVRQVENQAKRRIRKIFASKRAIQSTPKRHCRDKPHV
jgi:RNA polymerase primary sigma factor